MCLCVASAGMPACFLGGSADDCARVEEYQSSESGPQVRVPAGLDRPEETERLEIPPGPIAMEPLSRQAGCLPRPPDYFDRPIYVPEDD